MPVFPLIGRSLNSTAVLMCASKCRNIWTHVFTAHPMRMPAILPALAIGLAGSFNAASAGETSAGLIYHPQDDAIAIKNGTRWDNRPLYCHERFSYVWTGEMPGLRGEAGIFRFGIERDDKRVMLHQFSGRVGCF